MPARKSFKRILLASLLLLMLVSAPVAVHAQANDSAPDTPVSSDEAQQRRYDYGNGQQGNPGSEPRQRGCEARADSINAIMARTLQRAESRAELFATISQRVQAFYERQGNELASYDDLVLAVNTAQAKIQGDLRRMTDAAKFSCSSDQPKEDIQAFQQTLRTVVQDLKEYRTVLKDLIAGVRTAQGGGE